MTYFLTEAQRKDKHSTCLFEFQKGIYDNRYWCENSICLHADIFDELKLFELFSKALPRFDYYGHTIVTAENWEKLLLLSHDCPSKQQKVILELASWVEECFKTEKAFTICGI